LIGERSWLRPLEHEALGWIGSRVDDVYGMTIGKVVDVWTDEATGEPQWLVVRGGRFGGHYTLVPYEDASGGPEDVWIPYEMATVRNAPTVIPTEPLDVELEARFVDHYAAARDAAMPTPPPLPPVKRRSEHAHRLG
jgi:sporulation protein YlmC with PRC-barrel domain